MNQKGPRRQPGLAAIVLAGGRSRRFGSDKLAAAVHGRPLLWHPLEAVAPLVDELVVVLAPDAPVPALPRLDGPVRVARDRIRDGGPLVGLLGGLAAVESPRALVVGGDMPRLRSGVLEALVAALVAERPCEPPAVLAGLVEAGQLRPLPIALSVRPAFAAAERLVADGSRSLRALVAAVIAARIDEAAWRPLDPEGWSLWDVDTREDLAALPVTAEPERTSRRSH